MAESAEAVQMCVFVTSQPSFALNKDPELQTKIDLGASYSDILNTYQIPV